MVMKLPEYSCLESKKDFFTEGKFPSYDRIDTISDFEEKVLKLKNEKDKYIFRGVSEAKYKMFSSAQREYIFMDYKKTKIDYLNFINKLLLNIKDNKIVTTFCKTIGYDPNDLFYLSLLQHYGAPSPLIDFTKDFETALFFATETAFDIEKQESEIDNYFSLYYLEKVNNFYSWYSLQNASYVAIEKEKKLGIKNRISSTAKECASWENQKGVSIAILDDKEELKDNDGYFSWPNLNLVAQKGCFIMYLGEKDSLEEHLKKVFLMQPFHCFDIHKSLIETIHTHYCKKTREDLFPEMKTICNDAYNQFKQNLNK